ncbi:MAG: ABC transporter ATP-binding protein [Holosporaceae bacterium]|jgi:ABC-2 type transport system ATP-binding protein|nr:ABC transporter ATP-binding protein [Holosporaceae bacterium]
MNKVVVVENLNVMFGDFYAVKNVSFSVTRGEIFGFLGSNGAGKTTTIRVLCGLLPATSGDVVIDGVKFIAGSENLIKKKIGYVSQKFTLYDDLTIGENLELAAKLRNVTTDVYKERKKQLLEFIGFKNNNDQIVAGLPGGIKQEIALVAALLHDPKIIFLDEPTAGVAPVARDKFWNLIKKLSAAGKTIFVTTHYMDEAENCNRIALMRSGELIALDSPHNLKKITYQRSIYSLTARNAEARRYLVANASGLFDMFAPYGLHYHAIIADVFEEREILEHLEKYCSFQKIPPSLEDVFIKLLEEDRR